MNLWLLALLRMAEMRAESLLLLDCSERDGLTCRDTHGAWWTYGRLVWIALHQML